MTETITKTPWANYVQKIVERGWAEYGPNGELRNRLVMAQCGLGCPPFKSLQTGYETKMKIIWIVEHYRDRTGKDITQKLITETLGSVAGKHIRILVKGDIDTPVMLSERRITRPRKACFYNLTTTGKLALREWRTLNPSFDEDCNQRFARIMYKN